MSCIKQLHRRCISSSEPHIPNVTTFLLFEYPDSPMHMSIFRSVNFLMPISHAVLLRPNQQCVSISNPPFVIGSSKLSFPSAQRRRNNASFFSVDELTSFPKDESTPLSLCLTLKYPSSGPRFPNTASDVPLHP